MFGWPPLRDRPFSTAYLGGRPWQRGYELLGGIGDAGDESVVTGTLKAEE